jgi:hypothetical protein
MSISPTANPKTAATQSPSTGASENKRVVI